MLVLLGSASAQAQMPSPTPTEARAESPRGAPEAGTPFETLAHLPDDVPLTVLIPSPERFFRKLEAQLDRLSPSAALQRVWFEGIAEVIGGPVNPATFRRLGIGVDRELGLIFDPDANVAIVRFALSDRRRFEAWLARTVPEERRSMEIGRERAIVLYPDSEMPIICLLRVSHAHCQLGTGEEERPGRALQRLTTEGIRPLAEASDFKLLRAGLDEHADALVFVRPKRFTSGVDAFLEARTRRAHRFASNRDQRGMHGRAESRARLLRSWLSEGRLAALSLSLDRGRVDGRLQVVLEPRAAERLAVLVPTDPPSNDIMAWSDTPSLARLLLRLEPSAAAALYELLGLQLPSDSVDGSFSAHLLGVDTECRAAKSLAKDPRAPLFFMPVAAAIGLRGPVDAKTMIMQPGSAGARALFSGVQLEPTGTDGQTFRAEHLGSPLEVRMLDGVALMGTGHGAAAAAERRWSARVAPRSRRNAFLELSVDLAAVRAALAAARIERSNEELKRLHAMEQKMDLWLAEMRRLDLSAALVPSAPQLTVHLSGR